MLIKICGITRLEDARFAVECGANALGFVFWPGSPRAIDPARAQVIAASLPPFVTPVGVFVNQPVDFVNGVAADVGLGVVQLHGDETVDFATCLTRPVLKALTLPFVGSGSRACDITSTAEIAETAETPRGNSRRILRAPRLDATLDEAIDGWPSGTMILLDAHDPVRRGGTGLTIDWTRAASIAARRPIVLAGGLNPDNVAAAIDRVRPFGIDVSSGVEAAPGVKDHGLLRRLFEVIRQAESTQSPQRTQWTGR
jgi:phosphoribosylanthranilate isomerase